jgi:hypothetical protein
MDNLEIIKRFKSIFSLAVIFMLSICLSIGLSRVMAMETNLATANEYNWNLPEWTPKPVIPEDMGRFKAPTLRNIALTAPYMHDGSIATLQEAIAHYQAGGRTLTEGKWTGIGSSNPYQSGFIQGFEITETEINDLIEFLQSLTDDEFITNPAYSNPRSIQ